MKLSEAPDMVIEFRDWWQVLYRGKLIARSFRKREDAHVCLALLKAADFTAKPDHKVPQS